MSWYIISVKYTRGTVHVNILATLIVKRLVTIIATYTHTYTHMRAHTRAHTHVYSNRNLMFMIYIKLLHAVCCYCYNGYTARYSDRREQCRCLVLKWDRRCRMVFSKITRLAVNRLTLRRSMLKISSLCLNNSRNS